MLVLLVPSSVLLHERKDVSQAEDSIQKSISRVSHKCMIAQSNSNNRDTATHLRCQLDAVLACRQRRHGRGHAGLLMSPSLHFVLRVLRS